LFSALFAVREKITHISLSLHQQAQWYYSAVVYYPRFLEVFIAADCPILYLNIVITTVLLKLFLKGFILIQRVYES